MIRLLTILLAALAVCAPAARAEGRAERTPAEAERLYRQIGEQLFCTCGCRDNLLDCSHNVCAPKEQERAFLKELCRRPGYDEAGIKQQMVKRFGPEVLQAPSSSLLYPLLGAAAVVLLAGFGTLLHFMIRRPPGGDDLAETEPDELEQRIERELKEMD